MAAQPTQQPQAQIPEPPAFPLSSVECVTFADELMSAATALHQFAEKRAHGLGLEDPEAAALWRRFALVMMSVEKRGKDFSQRLMVFDREVRRWGGLDG